MNYAYEPYRRELLAKCLGPSDGRPSQTTDGVLGETVNYTYDMWNRLMNATAANGSWGEGYTFDGFSIQGDSYPPPEPPYYVWDVENRLVTVVTVQTVKLFRR